MKVKDIYPVEDKDLCDYLISNGIKPLAPFEGDSFGYWFRNNKKFVETLTEFYKDKGE